MEKYAELKSLIEKIYRRAEDKAVCFSYSEPANLKTPRRWVGKLFPVVTEIEVNVSEVWAFEAGIRGLTVKRLLRKAGLFGCYKRSVSMTYFEPMLVEDLRALMSEIHKDVSNVRYASAE